MEWGNAWRMVSLCVCVFMVCGHLLLPLPPTHSKCISVKHLLTSHRDFAHLKNRCCKSVKVNGLRPHAGTLCVGVQYIWLKSNMSTSAKNVITSAVKAQKQITDLRLCTSKAAIRLQVFITQVQLIDPGFVAHNLHFSANRPLLLHLRSIPEFLYFRSILEILAALIFFFSSIAVHRPQSLYLYY